MKQPADGGGADDERQPHARLANARRPVGLQSIDGATGEIRHAEQHALRGQQQRKSCQQNAASAAGLGPKMLVEIKEPARLLGCRRGPRRGRIAHDLAT